jgi:hypothetical protein
MPQIEDLQTGKGLIVGRIAQWAGLENRKRVREMPKALPQHMRVQALFYDGAFRRQSRAHKSKLRGIT